MRWSDIRNVLYINLDERTDRKERIEEQMKSLGLKATRVTAVKHEKGAIGCTLSHIRCLETAVWNSWDHVLVLEDDVHFLDPALCIRQTELFLEKHQNHWDVLLLGANNQAPYYTIDDTCVQICKCFSAVAYLVRGRSYILRLLECFRESLVQAEHDPCDVAWNKLQQEDRWFLLQPLCVSQQHCYSNIQNTMVNYDTEMLTMKHDPIRLPSPSSCAKKVPTSPSPPAHTAPPTPPRKHNFVTKKQRKPLMQICYRRS